MFKVIEFYSNYPFVFYVDGMIEISAARRQTAAGIHNKNRTNTDPEPIRPDQPLTSVALVSLSRTQTVYCSSTIFSNGCFSNGW